MRFGAWWQVDDPVREGERLLLRWPANRKQGRLMRGGALFLTDARLVFRPHRLDRRLGGHAWEADLTDVVATEVAPRTGGLFDGSMVDRLQVRLRGGEMELFVVGDPPGIAATVDAAASGAGR